MTRKGFGVGQFSACHGAVTGPASKICLDVGHARHGVRPADAGRVGHLNSGTQTRLITDGSDDAARSPENRLAALEAAVGTMQAAIMGLHARVNELEAEKA